MRLKKHLIVTVASFLFIFFSVHSQDRLIYHTRSQEQFKIYDSHKEAVSSQPLRVPQGSKVKIRIMNPNPLFYKYELRYALQEATSEDQELTDALTQIATLVTSFQRALPGATLSQLEINLDIYLAKVNNLMNEISAAQAIIDNSDMPETEADILIGNRNGGLRYAIDQITGNASPSSSPVLTSKTYGFHDPKLLENLNKLLEPLSSLDSNQLNIYRLVNSTLFKKVQEMKKNLNDVKAEIDQDFIVTDKEAIVYLIITPIDPTRNNLRKLHPEETKLEIVRVIPDFERAVIELVPVISLFYGDYPQYYLEDGIVQTREENNITYRPGLTINVNLLSFGKSKEMALGVGLGYNFKQNENDFENLYFSTLFSYKSSFRIGFGLGWGQTPSSLKSGGQVGLPLPDKVIDLEDLVNYEPRPAAFLTLAFTALDLYKKNK